MKIAIYIQDMRASGVARTMIAMARAFAAGPDQISVLAGYRAGIFGREDIAPADFVAAADCPARRMPRLMVAPHLRRKIREMQPDIILSGGNFGHFSLWAATRGLKVPIVYVFSNAMQRPGQPFRNRWRRFWSGVLVKGAARSIVVGANLADSPVFQRHVASGKAVLIRNGIDLSAIPGPGGSVPQPMTGSDPVILSIGRLQPQKNFEALIDAVAETRQTRSVRLVVLGTGTNDYRHSLIDRAKRLGIEDHVLFAGVTDNVFPWLYSAKVFALASRWEGASIALLEAMAAGTPIVASQTAGDAADVLGGGKYGSLVDTDDIPAFAAALIRQIETPIYPGERVRDFDAVAMMRQYHEVLMAACRLPEPPPSDPLS